MAIALSIGITIFLGGSSHPTVAVTTGSMLPIYNGFQDDEYTDIHPFRGDILLVKKVPIETIEVGDVIVFDTPSVSDPVVHRVAAKWQQNDSFIFKTNGDNNEHVDPWEVSGDEIHGVVVLRIPHIGWFLLVVQTTVGKILILALAVLILFMGDDSEEEAPSNEKGLDTVQKQKENSLVSKTIDFFNKIIRKKSYLFAALALTIIILFLGSNLIYSFLNPPSIKLYRIDDEFKAANLILAPSPLVSRDPRDYWDDSTNQTACFFPIQIEIQSGGIFNNIDRFEIRVNETKGKYCWNTVYNFVGTRVFKGGIIAVMNTSSIITASVSVSLYSRGLFASSPQFKTFTISLRSQ
ncbi:MAG: signal peptidase I [Candidatus Heimdallarchaeota archaeon]|nr:MAG: signal peptidase I [Candidatus Heimdallarchaeota archaeon]